MSVSSQEITTNVNSKLYFFHHLLRPKTKSEIFALLKWRESEFRQRLSVCLSAQVLTLSVGFVLRDRFTRLVAQPLQFSMTDEPKNYQHSFHTKLLNATLTVVVHRDTDHLFLGA